MNAGQKDLLGKLVGLARATEGNEELITGETDRVLLEALAACREDSSANCAALAHRAREEKRRISPSCFACAAPCGRTDDWNPEELEFCSPQVRAVKEQILCALTERTEAGPICYKALIAIGADYLGVPELTPILKELQK